MNASAKWIWPNSVAQNDQYAEFYDSFVFSGQPTDLYISADSNYAVYLNGSLVASGQYPDFPYYKVYDRIELTAHCREGKNHLAIIVWYYGVSNMSYYPGNAALRYEVLVDGHPFCCSDASTLSRISKAYHNGIQQNITSQLGFGYWYDLTREDSWMNGYLDGFHSSQVIFQDPPMHPRPVERCVVGPPMPSALIRQRQNDYLFDLGKESVGLLSFRVTSPCQQTITVCYGEHIADGDVRHLIGYRNFSVRCTLRAGENVYTNPFRRFGLRYLQVFSQQPLEIDYMSVRPVDYPLAQVGASPTDPLRQQIYDVAVQTLRLCMHDHYEDTPWREQALYAMDSRNQMLCGYYAFKEYRFPRACLLLMSKDDRKDGLLPICAPSKSPLTIPSFSLHFYTAVYEYTVYSGDHSLIQEIYPKLVNVLDVFIRRIQDGCVPTWTGKEYWNFYEWSDGLVGTLSESQEQTVDAALNCLLVIALKAMYKISQLLGKQTNYLSLADTVTQSIREKFFDPITCGFRNSLIDHRQTQLVNALAILCGAAQGDMAQQIAEKLAQGSYMPETLSMLCFTYDALLMADREKYKDHILADIDRRYKRMLDAGATSFWETEKGDRDFDLAGSLSHGWSAMPVYYYSILN